jgi:hypothetical protein
MLEGGIALVSCCLPRLHILTSLPSIRTAIDSIWSLVRIDSLRSRSSRNRSQRANRSDGSYIKTDDDSLTAPQTAFVPDKGNAVNFEAYSINDIGTSRESQKIGNGNIWVNKSVYRQETNV